VPLGSAVEALLCRANETAERYQMTSLRDRRILSGFPHPSSGNPNRIPQFTARRASLRRQLRRLR
jgi:hypothetical protein